MSTEGARQPSPRPSYNDGLAHLHSSVEDHVDMDLWMDTILDHGVYAFHQTALVSTAGKPETTHDESMETVSLETPRGDSESTTTSISDDLEHSAFAEETEFGTDDPFGSAKRCAKRQRTDQSMCFDPSDK